MYYLVTFLESLLAVFGIRAPEESRYDVTGRLDRGVEIRVYAPRKAVETDLSGRDDDAFRALFAYISGANAGGGRVAMTVPVAKGTSEGARLPSTRPVQQGTYGDGTRTMRFFLPEAIAGDPPAPTDPRVRLVSVPQMRVAVLRYSGRATPGAQAAREAELREIAAAAGLSARGAPFFMGYDPPFTLPFLRRNEAALPLDPA